MTLVRSEDRLRQSLTEIARLLGKHRVLDVLTQRQEGPRRDLLESLQHRQNLAELNKRLRTMHAADIAYVLEALPIDDRRTVWAELPTDQRGQVFVEVPAAVRESLVEVIPRDELVRLLQTLDPEDLGYVSEAIADDVLQEVARALVSADRTVYEDTKLFPEDSVGYYMTRDWVAVPEGQTFQQALNTLRTRGTLPPQTDRIFVVDARNVLRGAVPLQALLVKDPAAPIVSGNADDTVHFSPLDNARDAVKAFERYDLISAPVVDERGKLMGRLTVESAMDVLRRESELRALVHAGLSGEEDLFAAPWDSARNRWPWLGINLMTAFIASTVIGQFEGAIQSLAALAALMPIVASIGGNTGNQTMALVIRALALDRIPPASTRRLVNKELRISLLNGSVWGVMVGLFAVLLYHSVALGLVMSAAVVMNLVVAALAGVGIPLGLHAAGRDPAHGSSVLLTFITDTMGFFLFLGLASLFLA